MGRVIKFRAWCRDGDWDEDGEKQQFVMIDADSFCFCSAEPLSKLLKDIDDEQYIMQFTGLHDKNGKEIYEGDIISFEDDPNGIVKWNDKFSCWTYFEDEKLNDEGEVFDWSQLLARHTRHYVVKGNIYENPELLTNE